LSMVFWSRKTRPSALSAGEAVANLEQVQRLVGQGYSCSQAVLAAYSQRYGLDRELALALAAGFGSGMGSLGETCGAVTGAFMVIGLHCGGSASGKKKAYQMIREFAELFKARNQGAMLCRELLGCDPGTRAGQREAAQLKLYKKRCPKFVQDAVEILNQILGV